MEMPYGQISATNIKRIVTDRDVSESSWENSWAKTRSSNSTQVKMVGLFLASVEPSFCLAKKSRLELYRAKLARFSLKKIWNTGQSNYCCLVKAAIFSFNVTFFLNSRLVTGRFQASTRFFWATSRVNSDFS